MKKVGLQMSLLMGLSMSFFLSLIGTLSSGSFTIGNFLSGFAISAAVGLLITFLVPARKISASVHQKAGRDPKSLSARLTDAVISALLYSPLMTFIMISIAYRRATSHGAVIPFAPMLIRGEIISLIAAFILGFLLPPVLLKLVMKLNGISGSQQK